MTLYQLRTSIIMYSKKKKSKCKTTYQSSTSPHICKDLNGQPSNYQSHWTNMS